MKQFDKDGDRLNAFGVAGMDATGIPISQRHKIIKISEASRQEMFDETKRHFLQENGIANGDTTWKAGKPIPPGALDGMQATMHNFLVK